MNINMLMTKPEDLSAFAPEERIIMAAIECIDEQGLEGITVRTIASKAESNPASINYCYRSKEKLVETALREAWRRVPEDIDRIYAEMGDTDEALACAARYLVEGAYRHPKVVRAVIVEHPRIRAEAIEYLRAAFSRLGPRKGKPGEGDLSSSLLLAFTVLLGYGSEMVSHLTGIDIDDPEARSRLVEGLIRLLFGPTSS